MSCFTSREVIITKVFLGDTFYFLSTNMKLEVPLFETCSDFLHSLI